MVKLLSNVPQSVAATSANNERWTRLAARCDNNSDRVNVSSRKPVKLKKPITPFSEKTRR